MKKTKPKFDIKKFLKEIQKLCNENDVCIYVDNEVITINTGSEDIYEVYGFSEHDSKAYKVKRTEFRYSPRRTK